MPISDITTYLWFDDQALEAAEFYVGLFPNSSIGSVSYYPEDSQRPPGTVLVAEFSVMGRPFAALNGGPQFPHSEAVSFQVSCDTQDEIDHLWFGLVADGGEEGRCGWCKDRFGVSWQIVARRLGELMSGPDPEASQRAFQAMMSMNRIVIADLG